MSETRYIRLGGVVGAALGFPVVAVEGPFADDFTKLNWRYKDHRDGETAEFSVGGLRAYVLDCDGDGSVWSLSLHGKEIERGEEWACEPPHFFTALAAAEKALRTHAERLKAEILARRGIVSEAVG